MILAVVGGVIWWVMRKVGTPVAEFLDNRSQVIYILVFVNSTSASVTVGTCVKLINVTTNLSDLPACAGLRVIREISVSLS